MLTTTTLRATATLPRTTISTVKPRPRRLVARPWSPARWSVTFAALALATILVHGYHPLAEDGGLYAAGVELTLNRSLFPHHSDFVSEHLHYSIFAPAVAGFT